MSAIVVCILALSFARSPLRCTTVDGAIHRTAGPSLAEYCSQLPIIRQGKNYGKPYPVRLEAGQSIATPAFKLPCRKVIHTVGPDLKRPLRMANLPATKEEMKEQLRGCYATALRTCVDEGLRSVVSHRCRAGSLSYLRFTLDMRKRRLKREVTDVSSSRRRSVPSLWECRLRIRFFNLC